jgi:hypothetical protein
MKTLNIALIAATLLTGVTAPVFAADSDSPTARDQATSLWIATKDPVYGRLSGLSDQQMSATMSQPTNAGVPASESSND